MICKADEVQYMQQNPFDKRKLTLIADCTQYLQVGSAYGTDCCINLQEVFEYRR